MMKRFSRDSFKVAVHIVNVSRSFAFYGFTVLILCGFGLKRSPRVGDRGGTSETTSGDIMWSVDTIGADGSTLYDCCVVNDSLAYVVGWFMPHDSAAQSHSLDWYNAAVWNGSKLRGLTTFKENLKNQGEMRSIQVPRYSCERPVHNFSTRI